MEGHLHPSPNPIAERFRFNTRDRQPSETISEYMAVLRKLSEHCEYNKTLEDMLRDRLVCGVKNEKIQHRLLSEDKLTLKTALTIAQSMESATKYALNIQQHQASVSVKTSDEYVHKVVDHKECFRCGGTSHMADKCPFKERECFYCHRKGHTIKKCRQKERSNNNSSSSSSSNRFKPAGIRQLANRDSDDTNNEIPDTLSESAANMMNLYKARRFNSNNTHYGQHAN